MAVTGVPNYQRDHAVRMAKFARSVMECSQRILTDLQTSLGSDTADLAMRVGLHSGPVTAVSADDASEAGTVLSRFCLLLLE